MRLPMLKLGAYTFAISTAVYDTLTRNTKYNWTSQQRLNNTPQQQYTGPGEDSITLPGSIMTTWSGGLGQIDAMRDEAAKGIPLLMVDGSGTIRGYWVIKSIRETQRHFLPGGAAQRMDFNIELAFYGRTI